MPSDRFDGIADVHIKDGLIKSVSPGTGSRRNPKKAVVIDASGLWVAPGLVDVHTHLREPGYEYKETIATGTAAAAAGGFTTIMCMANTNPVNDNAAVTRFIVKKALEEGAVRVRPVGSVTQGMKGEAISEMVDMSRSGCAAFSDDGHTIMNSFIMRKALEYLRFMDMTIISHAEDDNLAGNGCCHEGEVSCRYGLKPVPAAAEEIIVARDIILARMTGGRVHFAHVSSEGALKLIADAKTEGLKVTCEVTPHHLMLTDDAVSGFDPNTRVSPPLRGEGDRQALRMALSTGVVDCIASDHAPHGLVDKEVEFDMAAPGISGIETSLPLCMKLVREEVITPLQLIELMSTGPSRVMGLDAGDLKEGQAADIVIIDPALEYTIDPGEFISLGKNSPFEGWAVQGRAVITLLEGKPVYVNSSAVGRLEGLKF